MYNQNRNFTTPAMGTVSVSADKLRKDYNSFMASTPRTQGMHEMSQHAQSLSLINRDLIEFVLEKSNMRFQRGMRFEDLMRMAGQARTQLPMYMRNAAPFFDHLAVDQSAAMNNVNPRIILGWANETRAFYNTVAQKEGL